MEKVLILHNSYKNKGGEDFVVEQEINLLKEYLDIDLRVFHNTNLNIYGMLKLSFLSIFNYKIKTILNENYKLIHVHNFFPQISPSIFYYAKKLDIKTVLTLHNYRLICTNALLYDGKKICEDCKANIFPWKGILKGCYKQNKIYSIPPVLMIGVHKILKTWVKYVDAFIFLTDFQKNKILEFNIEIPEEKIFIKPNFTYDYGFSLEKENYIVYIGRLSSEKGIDLLLKAFEKFPKFKLLILGSGEEKYLNWCKKLEKKYTNIKFLGFQSKRNVIEILKKAKYLVFPSRWYEAFPLTLIEAFSTATPVITSDIGNQAEIVRNNELGFHFKNENVDSLIFTIKTALNISDDTYYKLSTNVRKEYEKKYTPEKNLEMLLSIYEKVLK